MSEHGYGVRAICPTAQDVMVYLPWCECGWTGYKTQDEAEANQR